MAAKVAGVGAAGGAAVGAAGATTLAAATLTSLGFTSGGVAAGSAAAAIQAIIGNVVAGSAFAAAQSAGATGSIVVGFGAVGATAIVAGVAIFAASAVAGISFGLYKGIQLAYYKEVVKFQSKKCAIAVLRDWPDKSDEEKEALLQRRDSESLLAHLVRLKRVWEDLKKDLEKDFEWFEPVVGDGEFLYTKDKGLKSRPLPGFTGLLEKIETICRTKEQAMVHAAIELLNLWYKLLDMKRNHGDKNERAEAQKELIRVLPILAGALVLLKRKWSKLKARLQEKYEWDEPFIGDGTFIQIKEAKKAGRDLEQLPDLEGLLEDIKSLCTTETF